MAISSLTATHTDRTDFLTQIRLWLANNGWTCVQTDAGTGEFVAYSDASGQDTTDNIVPGFERTYVLFSTFPGDGANEVKMQTATFVDNFGGTPASPADLKGIFGSGTLLAGVGRIFDNAGAGDFIINTDGASGKGGTWIGVWSSGAGGAFGHAGVWHMPRVKRAIRQCSTLVGTTLTLAAAPPKRWNPANYGGEPRFLEIAQHGGTGPGAVERIQVNSVSGNNLILDAAPTFPNFGANSLVSDWMHTRAVMKGNDNDSGAIDYKTLGDFAGDGVGAQGTIQIVGSNNTEGDPGTARNSYEAAGLGLFDDTNNRGLLFQVNPACMQLIPKGSLIAGTDEVSIPNKDRTGFMRYAVRNVFAAVNYFCAVRVA